jgi:hypothetical protein
MLLIFRISTPCTGVRYDANDVSAVTEHNTMDQAKQALIKALCEKVI